MGDSFQNLFLNHKNTEITEAAAVGGKSEVGSWKLEVGSLPFFRMPHYFCVLPF
jgi:hypothetical protein